MKPPSLDELKHPPTNSQIFVWGAYKQHLIDLKKHGIMDEQKLQYSLYGLP